MLRRASARHAVTIDEVVVTDAPLTARRRPDPGEAIGQVALSYPDRARDYLSATATALLSDGGPLDGATTALVLDAGGARAAAERLLLDRTAQRDTLEFTAPPSLAGLEVGDALALAGQGDGPFEIVELRDGLASKIAARALPPVLAVASVSARETPAGNAPPPKSDPVLDAAHLPPSPDALGSTRLALGSFAQPWPGSVGVTDELTGTTLAQLSTGATLGELLDPLPPGAMFTWDDAHAVTVLLYGGHLSSRDDDEVLAGANCMAVETDSGRWEVIGFAAAELIAPASYRLTRLLRGQMGTDHAIGPAAAGNRVMLLDGRVAQVPVSAAWLDTSVELRSFAGPFDAEGEVSTALIDLDAILPLAPVHLSATRGVGSSDVSLSWMRRSRADSDSWAPDDAPLEHMPEAYRVTIFAGATPVRSIAATGPAAMYPAAEQTADFGAPPSDFVFTVAQLSPLYGPGHAAEGGFHA